MKTPAAALLAATTPNGLAAARGAIGRKKEPEKEADDRLRQPGRGRARLFAERQQGLDAVELRGRGRPNG